MKPARIQIAKQDIYAYFDGESAKVYTWSQMASILLERKVDWRLAKSTETADFIQFLIKQKKLCKVQLSFPKLNVTRYTWGQPRTYELCLSLKPNAYFSHYTAMFLHELTEQIPKTVFVNCEQPPKRFRDASLIQGRIDAAFKRPPRMSRNIAQYGDQRVCILNGKHTGNLGVVHASGPQGEEIRVTDLERTLIDIVVRPAYSGGVFEVLKAYTLAHGKVSINKLAAMLKSLDHVYPYHQCIGFYLERSGVYSSAQIDLLRKFEMRFDFYLTHEMKDMAYSKEWRLFFPKGL
jgi:predicted transcriptional regulator of viral defense system